MLDLLENALPGDVALIENEDCFLYSDLLRFSDLVEKKVPSRSLVVFLADNTAASIMAYVALLRVGAVMLMVKKGIDEESLHSIIKAFAPSHIWCRESGIASVSLVSMGEHALYQVKDAPPSMDSRLALLLPTSGSLGGAKYVRVTYENILSNACSIKQYLGICSTDRAVTTLPFSYSYGISIVNSHLVAGASLLVTERSFFDRLFWDACRDREVTTFGGVPYSYEMLRKLHFDIRELPSLRYLTQAGGPLGSETHRWMAEECLNEGIDFVVMYGQTEATARMAYLPPEFALEKVGSVGIAIPGGRMAVLDEVGAIHDAPGALGELVYWGANVTMGYASEAGDLMHGDEFGGCLQTGDIARIDEDGFFEIVGRKKRIVKVYGNRLGLDEMENMLRAEGYSVACIGKDDLVTIFCDSASFEELADLASKKTGFPKRVFNVKTIDSLPRSESGKILYSELSAWL